MGTGIPLARLVAVAAVVLAFLVLVVVLAAGGAEDALTAGITYTGGT